MIAGLGTPEIILIVIVIILLFGVGRISKIFREVGSGMRNFREGLKGDDETKTDEK